MRPTTPEPWTIRDSDDDAIDGYEIFEYACHEGNYAVPNALSGQRVLDARAAAATENQ